MTNGFHLKLSILSCVQFSGVRAQSDSIQFLNFPKKWFIQYSIQYCFTQDSIKNIIQLKINSADSKDNSNYSIYIPKHNLYVH